MADELDAIDARILDILQHDAGLSVADVAEKVGLSASPCWRRIKRLEDSGLITKRVTLLNAKLLGPGGRQGGTKGEMQAQNERKMTAPGLERQAGGPRGEGPR